MLTAIRRVPLAFASVRLYLYASILALTLTSLANAPSLRQ